MKEKTTSQRIEQWFESMVGIALKIYGHPFTFVVALLLVIVFLVQSIKNSTHSRNCRWNEYCFSQMVYLIQVFLPLYDNNKQEFDGSLYDDLQTRLKDQFGGVTIYRNAPADGLWKDENGKTNFDELIVAEVMITELNKEWWHQFRKRLEDIFKQEEILIRSIVFEKL